jgi:hypothetical protein
MEEFGKSRKNDGSPNLGQEGDTFVIFRNLTNFEFLNDPVYLLGSALYVSKLNKMHRRTFVREAAVLTTATLLIPGTSLLGNSNPLTQKNWAWARPNAKWSIDNWKSALTKAKEKGIDAILLEVYNGTTTYFEGGQLPMVDNLTEKLIPVCQSIGMEFHAWMWTMPCNAPSVIEKHADWFAVNRLGQPAHTHPAYVGYYKFLCPCHPEVREFIQGNVASLGKISEIDGIHLDYVRLPDVILAEALQPKYKLVQDREFPEFDYSYSSYCRQQFMEKSGLDPVKDIQDPANHQEWVQFRRDSVSHLVNNALAPEARKYGKQITAAVFPNWQHVRQEWHTWDLDGFLPMLYHGFYNQDIDFIQRETKASLERLQHKKPVYSGVFVPDLTPEKLPLAIREGLNGGASGFSLFDLGSMTQEHWQALG